MRVIKCQMFLLIGVVAAMFCGKFAHAQEANTNYFLALNREVDLARSIFVETNSEFDERVCALLGVKAEDSVEVRYLQVSFFFFYPNTNDVGPSSTEMDVPHLLVSRHGHLTRSGSATNEAPLNYIRVFDPTKRKATAELQIFVALTPVDHRESPRYLQKSFKFDYDKGWRHLK